MFDENQNTRPIAFYVPQFEDYSSIFQFLQERICIADNDIIQIKIAKIVKEQDTSLDLE